MPAVFFTVTPFRIVVELNVVFMPIPHMLGIRTGMSEWRDR